jgi:hypothetical protein
MSGILCTEYQNASEWSLSNDFFPQDFLSHSPGYLDLQVSYIYVAQSCLVLEYVLQSWKQRENVVISENKGKKEACVPTCPISPSPELYYPLLQGSLHAIHLVPK